MTKAEMINKVEELNEMKALLEDVKLEVESIEDELKAEMLDRDTEELDLNGKYILRWTSISSSRFNTSEFKKTYAELYKSYCKEVQSRRFTISA